MLVTGVIDTSREGNSRPPLVRLLCTYRTFGSADKVTEQNEMVPEAPAGDRGHSHLNRHWPRPTFGPQTGPFRPY